MQKRKRYKHMKSRVLEAANHHKNGYNCSQSVICTYADLLGIDEVTAFRVSEGFGLGIAKEYRTCGSVCAMILAAGLKNSDANLEKPASKLDTFAIGHAMIDKFEEMNTTSICKLLRGTDGITDRIRSCRGCVMDCAQIIEETLFPDVFEKYTGPKEFSGITFEETKKFRISLEENQYKDLLSKEKIEEELQTASNVFAYDILCNDVCIGFAMLREYEPQKYFLWNYAIDKEYQNQRYGKIALQELISFLKNTKGMSELVTTYSWGNEPAQRLYESVGFVEEDIVDEAAVHEVNMIYPI